MGSMATTRPSIPHRKTRTRHASTPIHHTLASGWAAASDTGMRRNQAPTLRISAHTQLAAVNFPWSALERAPAKARPARAPYM